MELHPHRLQQKWGGKIQKIPENPRKFQKISALCFPILPNSRVIPNSSVSIEAVAPLQFKTGFVFPNPAFFLALHPLFPAAFPFFPYLWCFFVAFGVFASVYAEILVCSTPQRVDLWQINPNDLCQKTKFPWEIPAWNTGMSQPLNDIRDQICRRELQGIYPK